MYVIRREILLLVAITTLAASRHVKVCPGTLLFTQELTNFSTKQCNVIQGSLILTGSSTTAESISPLSSIMEITGNLYAIYLDKSVDNLGQILPNLSVIRSNPYFRFLGVNSGLSVVSNPFLKSISLISLTHILGSDIWPFLWNNMQLQYIHTVDWKAISSENGKTQLFNFDNSNEIKECPEQSLCDNCWNEYTCQRHMPHNCSAMDNEGNCTCHEECLSSCSGTTDRDCLSCRHYHYDGQCVSSCPKGTVILAGWRCVEVCPYDETDFSQSSKTPHLMYKFNDACVFDCPENYTEDNETRTCVLCNGTSSNCSRYCSGREIRSMADAETFKGCTHVNGNLLITIVTQGNEEEELSNYLGSIEHVFGYVVILNCPTLRGLQFLDNLKSIRGDSLWQLGQLHYGLAIVGNRNLRSISWKEQHNLFLYGRIDVRIVVRGNFLLCNESIQALERLLPYVVDHSQNGLLAVCNVHPLNLTVSNNANCTTDLLWNDVSYDSEAGESLIGYNIMWYRTIDVDNSTQKLSLSDYNENEPMLCDNQHQRWSKIDLGNKTNYQFCDKMLHPWEPTNVQVRAKFVNPNVGFQSNETSVPGYIRVPSCPTMVSTDEGKYNVIVNWSPPWYGSSKVIQYQVGINQVQSMTTCMDSVNATGDKSNTHFDDEVSCMDTAISRCYFQCINTTITRTFMSSFKDSHLNISNLGNFKKYEIKIQAVSAVGCGPAQLKVFTTKPDYFPRINEMSSRLKVLLYNKRKTTGLVVFLQHLRRDVMVTPPDLKDKVTNLSTTTFWSTSTNTERVLVSWIRPKHPNGGCIRFYMVTIRYEEVPNEQDVRMHELKDMNGLKCEHHSVHQKYSCKIASNETEVSVNFTLFRIHHRQRTYNFSIRVASAGLSDSELNGEVPVARVQVVVNEYPTDDSGVITRKIVPSVVVTTSFLLVLVVFMGYIRRLKRHKHRLRKQLEVTSHLYWSLAQDEGMLITNSSYTPDDWEINREDVVLVNELGNGAFGLVYRGTWQMDQNQRALDVAVKTLNDNSSEQDRLAFLNEASIMKNFETDRIVRLLGIVSIGNPVMVVMELMVNGDLKGYLRSLRPGDGDTLSFEEFPLQQNEMIQFAVQIASGMAYLSEKKFIHRDLAARNCMLDKGIAVKIGDFGLTRDAYETDYYRKRGSGPLPIRWMAPESLQDGVFSHATDVWSFGIVLWEIVTLAMQPYPGMSNSDVFDFVIGGGVMDLAGLKHAPSVYISMMEQCWHFKATERPTFETILSWLPSLFPTGYTVEVNILP